MKAAKTWEDFAPNITRQHIKMAGLVNRHINADEMIQFLKRLAVLTNMEVIAGPGVLTAHERGKYAFVHWKTSGAHVYTYPQREWAKRDTDDTFFTVDCYTCKPFDAAKAARFTKDFLKAKHFQWRPVDS